jgi:hypothetical protein
MKKLSKTKGRIKDTRGTIGEAQKETCYDISLHAVGSILCVVIPISMCVSQFVCVINFNLFYVSYFKFLYNCFLNFIVHKINSKIVKSRIIKVTERKRLT